MAQGLRYKFQGSSFSVQTALQATKTISAITAANPPVVTSTAHGYLDNDVVKILAVLGMTQLNGNLYVVDNPVANTFELTGVAAAGYTPYTSGGTAQKVTFSEFCELTSFNQQDASADEIDVTTICSTAKEFEVGLSDAGSLSLEYNYAGAEAVQTALRAAKIGGDIIAFKLMLPNSGGLLVMLGSVQSQGISGGVGGVLEGTATIKLTGEIYVLS